MVLLTDGDGNSLLAFHHFHTLSHSNLQVNQKLVAIAGFDHLATPVIINASSIKNYSQNAPKWESLSTIQTVAEFQNYNLETESTTSQNTIIIPIPIICVILTSPNQSPANLALLILNEMKHLDHLSNIKNGNEL